MLGCELVFSVQVSCLFARSDFPLLSKKVIQWKDFASELKMQIDHI